MVRFSPISLPVTYSILLKLEVHNTMLLLLINQGTNQTGLQLNSANVRLPILPGYIFKLPCLQEWGGGQKWSPFASEYCFCSWKGGSGSYRVEASPKGLSAILLIFLLNGFHSLTPVSNTQGHFCNACQVAPCQNRTSLRYISRTTATFNR